MEDDLFKDFITTEFPKPKSAVYVLFFSRDGKDTPFYVGETVRVSGRISDYGQANFKAPTDFKVGEAIKYLQGKGYKILIKYRFTENREREEDSLLKHLQNKGYRLLNELRGYNYHTANPKEEKERVINFCDIIINGYRT